MLLEALYLIANVQKYVSISFSRNIHVYLIYIMANVFKIIHEIYINEIPFYLSVIQFVHIQYTYWATSVMFASLNFMTVFW